MFGVTDSTLLLIYALPIAGLLLGMLPAIFVWHCSKWWQKKIAKPACRFCKE